MMQGANVRALALSNPCLCVASRGELEKIVAFCARHSLLLLADESSSMLVPQTYPLTL